jgi:hypothetical protein
MSNRSNGKPLWWVRPMDGMEIDESAGHLFAGYVADMLDHISELHRETGRQHAATSAE